MTSKNQASKNDRGAPRLLPHQDSEPLQVLIPGTGKKLLGFLLDESADGVAVQVRRTRCVTEGDLVDVARNGRTDEAVVKHVSTYGVSTRIGLAWIEPLDDLALVTAIGVGKKPSR